MTVLDANLLLNAYDSGSLHHTKSRLWLQRLFSSGDPVGLPWQSVSAFCRIVTNRHLPGNRFTTEEAVEIVETWVRQPNVRLLAPGEQHWTLFRRQLLEGQASGPLVTDAQLAALTIEFGGILHSTDRDFARFPGLRCVNPLEE